MIRALLATATVAAITTFGHKLYRSGKLNGPIETLDRFMPHPVAVKRR